ncbi:hypothetical protein GQ55_3G384600 [Panicum hallii var. hallii]|uniref:Uncharacterized protein n=1 Tax=Panicum hallii var. hallii TaxID=1504633 RepID=A0A2T7EGE5_9POAL|nr:hypothetical protein GQ55_3G384600 [Panicum hallii var. hallii]
MGPTCQTPHVTNLSPLPLPPPLSHGVQELLARYASVGRSYRCCNGRRPRWVEGEEIRASPPLIREGGGLGRIRCRSAGEGASSAAAAARPQARGSRVLPPLDRGVGATSPRHCSTAGEGPQAAAAARPRGGATSCRRCSTAGRSHRPQTWRHGSCSCQEPAAALLWARRAPEQPRLARGRVDLECEVHVSTPVAVQRAGEPLTEADLPVSAGHSISHRPLQLIMPRSRRD